MSIHYDPREFEALTDLAAIAGFEPHRAFRTTFKRGELVLVFGRIGGGWDVTVHDDYQQVAALHLPRTTPEALALAMVRMFLDALPEQPHMCGAPLVGAR